MRKREQLKAEATNLSERLIELEKLIKEAENEETIKLSNVKDKISKLCLDENLFCGVVLSMDDILAIVKLAIESKESVRISFNLYFNI